MVRSCAILRAPIAFDQCFLPKPTRMDTPMDVGTRFLATAFFAASSFLPLHAQAQTAAPTASAQASSASQLEANKKIAVGFYNAALNDKDPDAAMKFVATEFKQHSVLVEDGYDGLKKFVDYVRKEQSDLHADITRVFAEGDIVILDVHMIRHAGDRGLAIAEIYRVADGKLVEHWDRIQEIPEKSKNNNGLF